jgi:CheY-like chemotaxis protein
MTLLYVDDDEEDVDVFTEAVEVVAPHTILHVATDCTEAFEVLNDLIILPDYIFLDINLPVMNGKEFLKQLKENKKLKNIPVVMCSTSSNNPEIEECRKIGAIDFVVKPPEFKRLCEILKTFL